MIGKTYSATFTLQAQHDLHYIPLPLTCHLISSSQDTICEITRTAFGQYTASSTPSECGKHRLHIQIEGSDISGSPFFVHVAPSPETRLIIKRISTITQIGPRGIATDNKQLIVAGRDTHSITIFEKRGQNVASFGSKGANEGQFTYPCGVAITGDGHILVTDKHRLQKLTNQGHCVMSVGSSKVGTGPLQFCHPRGIAVHPITGQIYVADEVNNRVQVFNNDLTYSDSIGAGQLSYPYDVALDGVGTLYVVNNGSHCIDAFASDGTHLRQFGSHGYYDEELSSPKHIAIDAYNYIYITEYDNHRISVFNTDGKFVQHIGQKNSGDFSRLCGIAADATGNLYVCDDGTDTITVLHISFLCAKQ